MYGRFRRKVQLIKNNVEMDVTCTECKSGSCKYKCSTCYSRYCSCNCWKKHKQNIDCKKPENIETVKQRSYATENTIDPEKIIRLGTNNELKKILQDRLLQKLLLAADSSHDPYDSLQKAMQDYSFMQFVDICLKTVEEEEF